jgi:transposase
MTGVVLYGTLGSSLPSCGGIMAAFEVPDELWTRISEVLPVRQRRHRWPRRKPLDDRACLNGILFVLLTGINRGDLPQQLGYGSGMTCWRRPRDWQAAGGRLIVRRTRLIGAQATLWPDWRYHAFVTDRPGAAVELDADHRRHAVVELAIRDLKQGAGLRHCPSGHFLANAAWALIATLAHNLLRWVAALGLGSSGPVVAKTLRRRLLTLPGRLTRSARRRTLHLPAGWPWAQAFSRALAHLRAIPLPG